MLYFETPVARIIVTWASEVSIGRESSKVTASVAFQKGLGLLVHGSFIPCTKVLFLY